MGNEKLREIKLTKASKYTILTMFLVGVLGVSAAGIASNYSSNKQDEVVVSDDVITPDDKEEEIVVIEEEKLIKPFLVNAQIKTYFYDLNDEPSIREKALVFYNGSYTPSTGIDYFYNNNTFDVIAVFSGKVIEKKVDPMYGATICIKHDDGLVAMYSSLSDIKVNEGDIVKQGDVVAKAGKNTINSSIGNHLNFSLIKNDKFINPNTYFSKNIKDI
jgi:stage II sporulation protein Q